MCSYDPAHQGKHAPDVPDPYYGGDDGFDRVFDMLLTACQGLLDEIEKVRGASVREGS
jgi:protein-tyrosine phosphatase